MAVQDLEKRICFMQLVWLPIDANPKMKLIYISTEEFTNEFIKSLRLERTQAFREKYRTADLLLVDDIHQLQGKARHRKNFFIHSMHFMKTKNNS